jgi:hypothetical protein
VYVGDGALDQDSKPGSVSSNDRALVKGPFYPAMSVLNEFFGLRTITSETNYWIIYCDVAPRQRPVEVAKPHPAVSAAASGRVPIPCDARTIARYENGHRVCVGAFRHLPAWVSWA